MRMQMKKIRKPNSTKRKSERKEAQKRLKEQTSLMMKHPKECCICKLSFERSEETVKTWTVTVREDRVHLTCPKCWSILTEALGAVEGSS